MKKNNKIITASFIVIIVFWLLRSEYKNYQLKNNYKFSVGRINRVTTTEGKYNKPTLFYEFSINNNKQVNENLFSFCKNLSENDLSLLLVNKSFPVAYSVKDANQSIIIITRKDAAMFNYTIPDSMLVYDSILTCK